MHTHKKVIITGIVLLLAGLIVSGVAFALLGFDITAMNNTKMVENEYEVKDSFGSIRITADTEEIVFVPSPDGSCKVVCLEDEEEPHNVRMESDTLLIDRKSSIRWHIGFFTEAPKITVYLPGKSYGMLVINADTSDVTIPAEFSFESCDIELDTGDIELASSVEGMLNIRTDTGDIHIHDLSASDISLSTDTGHITVERISCEKLESEVDTGRMELTDLTLKDLISTGDTGDLNMKNVIATGIFRIDRSMGDVYFDACDAAEIYVETETGDVKGDLLSDKVFLTQSDTGDIEVPKSISGGRCEITTDTGDIEIKIR